MLKRCAIAAGILATCLLNAVQVQGAPKSINWRNDVRIAAQESQTRNKPLLLEFSTDWCGYCKKMDKETFANVDIAAHVEACFVPVKVDGEAHRQLAERLSVRSFPTTIILSPEQHTVVARIKGFRTARQFRQELTEVCSHQPSRVSSQPAKLSSFFQNYCPVTLLDEQRFVPGQSTAVTDYHGFRIAFQSPQHKTRFERSPRRYWPVADGQCVVSAVDQRTTTFGRLQHAISYRERVWLFATAEHAEQFRAKPEYYAQQILQSATASEPTIQRR